MSSAVGGTSRSRMTFLIVLSIAYIYPFIFLASTALRTPADYVNNPLGLPRELTTENLEYAWDGANIDVALIVSSISVGLSVVILVLTSAAAAYWFLRHPGRWSRLLMLSL